VATAPRLRLRADRDKLEQILDRLDRAQRPSRHFDLRDARRFEFRKDAVPVSVMLDEERFLVCEGATRNLSRDGLGLLVSQFVYPGTPCTVQMRTRYNRIVDVDAVVVRCRYLVGSGALYELGLHFERGVDVEQFTPEAHQLRILLVDESEAVHRLVASFLAGRYIDLTCATSAIDAAGAALDEDYDLILLDLETPRADVLRIARALRDAGYLGPIVGMTLQTPASLEQQCEAAGCTGYLRKPLTRDALLKLVDSLAHAPVLSTLSDDPAMAPLIDEFVTELRRTARLLANACERGDYERLHALVRKLRADAGSYGFQIITDEAEHVQALAAIEAPLERLRPALNDLVHLCLAARPASFGRQQPDHPF
jgi:CheY-like chemotaxis protein